MIERDTESNEPRRSRGDTTSDLKNGDGAGDAWENRNVTGAAPALMLGPHPVMTHTTMEDIARECGVSKMTVSRVFGSGVGVSPGTREKVLDAAKRLKFETNALAQNLNRNRSAFIGVATPFEGLLGSNYFAEVFIGFQAALAGSGWDYALFDTLSEEFNDGDKLAKLYRQRKVDGLLIVAPHMDDRFLETLTDLRVPMVVIGESISVPSVCSVSCEDHRGITLSCAHLYALGHRRIAFLRGPSDLATARRREHAFRDFYRRKKLAVPDGFIQPGDYTMRSGRVAGFALLSLKDRPTAIIAANDMMAYGVMESARQLGIPIPDELSIVGFDDLPTATERYPALTTVQQPVAEMAERGAKILVEALRGKTLPQGHMRLEVNLIERQSSAPPPVPSGTRRSAPHGNGRTASRR
jgi:DNA-binding LacI/PurR family transcriptional regulator